MIRLDDLPKSTYLSFGKLRLNKNNKLIGIKEDRNFLKRLIKDFQQQAVDIKRVSKEIGIPRTLIYKTLSYKRKIRLEHLLKICSYLERNGIKKYSIDFLEKYLYSIESSRGGSIIPYLKEGNFLMRKFPFDFNTPEGVKCLTFPFGDGYITKDYSGHVRIGYVNSNNDLHEEVFRCIRHTFGIVNHSKRKVSGAQEIYFTGILGQIYVESLGFITGSKVLRETYLNKILKELKDPNLIGSCVSQFIDDEGHINAGGIYIALSSGIKSSSKEKHTILDKENMAPHVLKELRELLNICNIHSTFRKPSNYYDKTLKKWKLMYYLNINGYYNFLRLWPLLNINKGYLRSELKRKLYDFSLFIKQLEKTQKSKGYFTTNNISDVLDVSLGAARNYLRTLKKNKFVELIEKHHYTYHKGDYEFFQDKYRINIPEDLKRILYSF